ncbi:MAG TPA: OmpA family protein [Candidatus Cloacimonadota bacterium]|nr:OmpA family protein [Candidatus Cloacimonadota bacterium]HPT72157.1 OmpA family protein [Candidatus Cloacimonadota bacterium]
MKSTKIFILFLIMILSLCGCTVCRKSVDLHKGTIKQHIKICSKPTKAMIYINDKQIGKTPFKTKLEYGPNKLVNIKAVPLFPNQFTQNIYLSIPPVPRKMTIIMTQRPKQQTVAAQPADASEQAKTVVTVTKVDTVFVQQTRVEEKVIVPPVVYFEYNEVKPLDFSKIDNFVKMMMDKPDIMIDIYGYTDPKEDSNTLSLSRAKSVFNYMVDSGIDATRLHVYGTSGTMQTAMGRDSAESRSNRKVMFQLYYADQK